eukprot:4975238-Prymnesium_polylepis.2
MAERATGLDLDGDGDVGLAGQPAGGGVAAAGLAADAGAAAKTTSPSQASGGAALLATGATMEA